MTSGVQTVININNDTVVILDFKEMHDLLVRYVTGNKANPLKVPVKIEGTGLILGTASFFSYTSDTVLSFKLNFDGDTNDPDHPLQKALRIPNKVFYGFTVQGVLRLIDGVVTLHHILIVPLYHESLLPSESVYFTPMARLEYLNHRRMSIDLYEDYELQEAGFLRQRESTFAKGHFLEDWVSKEMKEFLTSKISLLPPNTASTSFNIPLSSPYGKY